VYSLPPSHFASARARLRAAAHNGHDVVVALTCWSVAPRCDCPRDTPQCGYVNISSSRAPECATLHAEAAAADYDALLLGSRFAFVLPGEGTHSYRLYEAMQAGAVPVVLGPSALPLPELINWDAIAVRQEDTSEHGMAALVRRLRAMPADRVQALQDAGRLVFESHLRDLPTQLEATWGALALKFLAASRQAAREAAAAATAAATAAPVPTSSDAAATTIPAAPTAPPDGVLEMRGGAAKRRRATQPPQKEPQQQQSPPPAAIVDALALAHALSVRLTAQVAAYHAELGQLTSTDEAQQAAAAVDASGGAAPAVSPPSRPLALTAETDLTLLRQAVAALLGHLGTVALPAGALVRRRQETLWVLSSLSQLYSLAGHWRAALTAAQAGAVLFPFDAGTAAAEGVDAGDDAIRALVVRVCNALYDARRPPAVGPWGYARPTMVAPPAGGDDTRVPHRPFGRFYRVVDELVDADDAVFAGYGQLSGYLGPTPLADVGAPGAAVLPLAPRRADRSRTGTGGLYHPDALLPHVAVDEATLQAVAARVSGALPARLPDFLAAHGVRMEAAYLSGPSTRTATASSSSAADADDGAAPPPPSRVAIVSLCVYNESSTALGRLSIANLQAYCEAHGYDCFVGTGSGAVDARRPIVSARPGGWRVAGRGASCRLGAHASKARPDPHSP
jgi:hypothetical protein